MKRFSSLFAWDIKIQAKYGFYYAAVFITLMWIVVLRMFPPEALSKAVPLMLFIDLMFTAFYFMAGLVFLEKVQGVLDVYLLTPTKLNEYLFSKVLTLALQSVFFSLIIALVVAGTKLNIITFILGIGMLSIICSLVGVAVASLYGSFSKFLIPSMIPQIIMAIPLFFFFGVYTNWVFYLLPTQPYLLLLKSAFAQIHTWEIVYCILYGGLWIVICYKWAYKRLEEFALRR